MNRSPVLMVAGLLALLLIGAGCKEKQKQEPDPRAQRRVRDPASVQERGRPLTAAEEKTLLILARRSLVASVSGLHPKSLTDKLRITPRLKRTQGAFVTLKEHGRLRGCIGYILPRKPLYLAVIDNARNAALYDRRFRPVTVGELPKIDIEISALSVPRKVKSYEDIVIGKHGIILSQGRHSATFLPHVATEQKWDRATTLTHLSRKAGLPLQAWQDPRTEYRVYTAQVWSEPSGTH